MESLESLERCGVEVWVGGYGVVIALHSTARVICSLQFVCTAQKTLLKEMRVTTIQGNGCKFHFSIKQREGT